MSDILDEGDIFESETQHYLNVDNDSTGMANEDLESVGSQSSTDSKTEGSLKGPLKLQGPFSKALQRVFRSRSSSPRIACVPSKVIARKQQKESPNYSEGGSPEAPSTYLVEMVVNTESVGTRKRASSEEISAYNKVISHRDSSRSFVTEESITLRNCDSSSLAPDSDELSDAEDETGWFSPVERISVTPPGTLRKLSRNSLARLQGLPADATGFKPMTTSRSFSCLQNSLQKTQKEEIPISLIQKASEEYFKPGKFKRKKYTASSQSAVGGKEESGPRDVPKVFISIDDDHPCSPEEENRFANFLNDSAALYETAIINADDGLPRVEKQSEEELSDRETTPRKVKNVLKSLSLWKLNKAGGQSPEQPRMNKQYSIDTEMLNQTNAEESFLITNSLVTSENYDRISATDSRLKVLKKLTLSLQGKDKSKSQESAKFSSDQCDELPTKGLHNDINSSEESIPFSVLEKNNKKGKFRELSNFLIKENAVHTSRHRKGNEDTFDDLQDPSSYSASELNVKNSKSFGEKVAEYLQRGGSRLQEQQRRLKSQIWSSVVTIVLIEGKDLPAMDRAGSSDPYVKFRLGNEKYKSKVEFRSLNPRWLEQFDFHLFEDQSQLLEITVWDKDPRAKDEFIGRCTLDMRNYERENTHEIWVDLEGESELHEGKSGKLFLLLTISGTTSSASISDLITHKENPNEIKSTIDRYKWSRTFHNLRDVGMLTVKIFKAQGLAAADFGVGKSDPFCVLELVNSRLQTQTEYKTLSPSWNKIFTFDVKDIHSVLEVTVYDEDRDHKVDFLGKMAIPLLKIKNGDKKWYALKDKKLRIRAKGNYPEILMECSVYWNPIRAAIQTFEPKEEKYMQLEQKFKKQIFVRNVNRIRSSIMDLIDFGLYIKSCFEWESPFRSVASFILFVIITYYFEVYMLPAFLLLLFLKNYVVSSVISIVGNKYHKDEDAESSANEDEIDEDDKDKDKEEKKSLKERLQAIQEVIATVQNVIGYIASFVESVKNTFNFTVPLLSWLMVLVLVAIMVVLYMIPVRFLVLMWGINKFSRKLIRPHSVVNNEITDFLSRVPDDEQLRDFRELKTSSQSQDERRKEGKKKKATS